MKRRELLRGLSGMVAASALFAGSVSEVWAGQKPGTDMYAHCAKVCADCAAECTTCAKHCSGMIAAGMKEHEKTKRLSEDTRDLCATAAKICARRGPMTAAICQACITACKECGAACGKYPSMKPMKDCAQACDACIKACQDMLAHLKAGNHSHWV
jgi:hypothetical protein